MLVLEMLKYEDDVHLRIEKRMYYIDSTSIDRLSEV
jgi:hypothetical protein